MSEINNSKDDKINQYDKLVVDISNNLITRLSDLMSKLLNAAQEKLFNLSDAADNNEEQARYYELRNQLRMLKPEIADNFSKNIKAYLVPSKDFEAKQEKQKPADDDELSLIDQDEMEGMVLVKGIGERAGAKYREQLSHLEARFEHLALKTPTVFKKDALIPTNFCQAFDDALADHFDNTNKKLLFSMFDVEIANKLDALYDSINNRLIDADILPKIKLSMSAQKSKDRPTKTKPSSAGNADEATQQNSATEGSDSGAGGGNNISGFAMTAAPGGSYRHTKQSSLQSQTGSGGVMPGTDSNNAGENPQGQSPDSNTGGMNSGTGNMNYGTNGPHSGEQNATGDGTEYQHYTAGMPASHVGRVLGNYIGAPFMPNTADKTSENYGDFFPESTPQHFGHEEIIQALSNIQNLPQFGQADEARFDGEAIKQAILAEIAKTSGGAVSKRINQIAEKTIDFIELIFDAIIDDEAITDTIKTLLLRLQIPIIKASMADQEFFIYDDHPARVLLDTIADVGIGLTDHNDEIYKHLDKLISGILGEYEFNTDTFQKALDNLNTIIEEQGAIARAIEEEEQKQLLRKHARATVLKALRATTTGKTLPEAVHPLILKRWPTLMFNHYLSNGKENNEWINMTLALRQIVKSVQPVSNAEQLAKLMSEKDALFEQTEKYLNISAKSKKDAKSIMDSYKDTVLELIDDANFTEEEVSIAAETISHAEPEEELPVEEKDDRPAIPSGIMPGMWFKIYMGEDKTPRRCKLSVIIVEDSNLMFVDHKGSLVAEKSFDEFSEEIAENKTKLIMGHSAFDYAFKTVIDKLN